jgi:hypothetical protein
MSDWSQDPTAKRWMEHVIDDMEPKMRASVATVSLVPEDRLGDVKFWVELGASICMDKPIIAVVLGDKPLPKKLAKVADEIVRCPDGIDEQASADLEAALQRIAAHTEGGD